MDNLFFESIFNNTIEGVILIEEGFIKDINSSMLDILDYKDKKELIGKLATGILIPQTNQHFLEYDKELYEEVSLVSSSGNIVPAIIKIKDIKSKNCKVVFVLNLTELKERESLLIEQSRMAAMGEMISMIAHQWRQPLSSISAVVSNLKFRIGINSYEKETLETKLSDITTYIKYMSTTIDDFRNFFKGNKEKELISLNEIVNTALEILEKPFLTQNIKIINCKKELKELYLLKNEMLQVILNILNNSKDAFLEKPHIENPTIKIDSKENEENQILIITDNAGGIPKDIINKIFDPYFSTKDDKNGTGLGLYMCKTIIEKHFKGKILVSNKNDGASFKIVIKKF